jgi:glutamine synthetase
MDLSLNPNPLVQYLGKLPTEFTKADLINYIQGNGIEMLNFRYNGADGRLKVLNFVIQGIRHLDEILTTGERVDGSSLFRHIEAESSDLYVVPRYRTAFLNPFTEIPTLEILCSYYDKDGNPLKSSPEYILHRAHEVLKERTGYSFETMGELEYYNISPRKELFEATDQRGYHEAFPFVKWEAFRTEAMHAIAQTGAKIKYGHSEVGNFSVDDKLFEQNEIEFSCCPVEEAADQLVIAKWILRSLAYKYGITITFAPKITVGKAGSGLHIHTRLMKDGMNAMVENGELSNIARRVIAGYLDLAPSLTAFGNTNPTSYFRLVPHQEAPTNICWGDRNRSVLVRVPLGWNMKNNMIKDANPLEPDINENFTNKQTVEFRCPDGSADIYMLMAGLTVAARHGLEMPDALEYTNRTYVDVNIFREEHKEKVKHLAQLPVSCADSADRLITQQDIYTMYNVFSKGHIEGIAAMLRSFNDNDLRERIQCNREKLLNVVEKYFHCG